MVEITKLEKIGSIFINKFAPNQHADIDQLISRIEGLVEQGKKPHQVFFYGPAVLQASHQQGKSVQLKRWVHLASSVPLYLCPNSVEKRELLSGGYAPEFQLGSLAQLFDHMSVAEEVICFG